MTDDGDISASDNDSRTAVLTASSNSHATVKPSASTSTSSRGRRRERRRGRKSAQSTNDLVPMGATFSKSAAYLDASSTNFVDQADALDSPNHGDATKMSLGKNRLATGFASQQLAAATDESSRNEPQPSHQSVDMSASDDTPIEISSDESVSDSDEGGMIVNIDQDVSEDGEVRSDTNDLSNANANANANANGYSAPPPPPPPPDESAPPPPPSARLKLEDLTTEELELQIRYALFHLDRDQIDLNRPVTCLACLQQGHMAIDCTENNCSHCEHTGHSLKRCPDMARCSRCRQKGHDATSCSSDMRVTTVPCDLCGNLSHVEQECPQRFFASPKLRSTEGGPVRLWVSCCICASKSHLVGDCPDADRSAAARWSLKTLPSGYYTNMSLEAGIKSLEHEAENRGMRPVGLQIKGRADIRHAGGSSAESSSDADEAFLRPSVKRDRPPNFRFGNTSNDRDQPPRFEGRSGQGSNLRDRGAWYATDSFGRRRSRSPMGPTNGDQWRPNYRREPSPRRFDGQSQYRPRSPPRGAPGGDSYRPDVRLPRKPNQSAPSSRHASTARNQPPVSLPTRKGSNPNLLASRGSNDSAPKANSSEAKGPKKKKNKNKNKQKS